MRRHSRLVTAPVLKSIRLLFLVVTLSLPPLLFVIVLHSLLVRLEHNMERLKRMDNLSPTVLVKDSRKRSQILDTIDQTMLLRHGRNPR